MSFLTGNNLGSKGAKIIAEYLNGNGALRTLILSGLFSFHSCVFCQDNESLCVCCFSENHIGDEGANAIWKSVPKSALEELYLESMFSFLV